MRKFHTDAILIRHHAKACMSDGGEYTAKDILSYIHRVHGTTGVDGEALDYRKVSSAFQNLIKMERGDYVKIRRGTYKMLPQSEKYAAAAIYGKISDILVQVKTDIKKFLADNLKITELPEEDIHPLRETIKEIYSLLEQAIMIMDYHEHNQPGDDGDVWNS